MKIGFWEFVVMIEIFLSMILCYLVENNLLMLTIIALILFIKLEEINQKLKVKK